MAEKVTRRPRLSLKEKAARLDKIIAKHEAALEKAQAAKRALIAAEKEAHDLHAQAIAEIESL